MNDIAISLKNVSKYYKLYNDPKDRLKEALNRKGKAYHKKFYATKNLNLEIKKGEVVGIVGKNGSGKSTLLKLITGVLKPDEGNISVQGNISALLELGSGFNPEFTGLQNIYFYGTILGFTKQEMEERLDDIIAFADIGDFLYQPLKTYSSGMKSRLGFAVAVHIDPEILILDEVLAVGDILFRRKCYAKMEEFFKSGKTIIYVSHDANSINQLCTRAVFLNEGNIAMDASPKEVTTFYEKFLFSPVDKQKEMIQSLSQPQQKSPSPTPAIKVKEDEKLSDYFLPELIPQSRVEYQNYPVTIHNIRITDANDQPVNVLISGKRYFYRYSVAFEMDAVDVSLGMQIKSEKGQVITATSLAQFEQTIDHVNKNEYLEMTWEFDCMLLPGIYYLNAGTSSLIEGERTFLHRIVDAACFKVISDHPQRFSGIVHFNQTPHIKRIS